MVEAIFSQSTIIRLSNYLLLFIQSILNQSIVSIMRLHFLIQKWENFENAQIDFDHWDDISHQRTLMDKIAKRLHIVDAKGWYHITAATLKMHGGAPILHKFNDSPSQLLMTVYPEYLQIHGTES